MKKIIFAIIITALTALALFSLSPISADTEQTGGYYGYGVNR